MAFKMEPIKYKFFPESDNKNLWIQIEPFEHNHGYGISFAIIERKHYEYQNGEYTVWHQKEFRRDSLDYWDNQLTGELQELSELIYFLGRGEIRGRYAETIVWRLFNKLYLHQGKVQEYFPKYYDFHKKSVEKIEKEGL